MTNALWLFVPIFTLSLILPSAFTKKSQKQPKNRVLMDDPQQDEAIKKLSQFFIELLQKYDATGSGLIKRQKYPMFLKDVFIKGSFGTVDHPYPFGDLLLRATTEFTNAKDQAEDLITVQQFYDDIIQKFTLYLMDHQQYKSILETLFEDIKQKKKKSKGKAEDNKQPQKVQSGQSGQL